MEPSREAMDVTIYTREGCHLCDIARERMERIAATEGVAVRFLEVDIDADVELKERYTNDVPVIFVGEREVFRHRVLAEPFRTILIDHARQMEVFR